jgi:hypothetical protein
MKTKLSSLLLGLTLALALSGCETVSTQPIQTQRTQASLAASKNRVWPLLVSQVGLEYPVRAIEKDSGLVTTDWVTLPAGFNNMDAGNWVIRPGGFLATWNGLRMNMKVMAVETEPGKTQVTINCHYEAFENNVQHAWLVVNSNGSIENAILTKIESQLLTATKTPELPPQALAAPAAKSTSEALLELKKLLDAQAITPAEYEAKKKILIEKL